jgi:hypothetical protein
MIKKSNSVPNFLFETPKAKNYIMKLNLLKIIPYSEFIKKNPNSTKIERQNAIKNFYDNLLRMG